MKIQDKIDKLLKNKKYNEKAMNRYNELSKIKIECPYCKSITDLWCLYMHLKTKKCKILKEIILKTNPEKEDQFKIQLNDIKKKIKYNKEYE